MLLTILTIQVTSLATFGQAQWATGEVDSSDNLIITELENRENCNNSRAQETITLTKDWGVLLYYFNEQPEQSKYVIFDNVSNRIYNTLSFERFVKELSVIPDSTVVRNIMKCTAPFSFGIPQGNLDELSALMKSKGCMLEDKLMYCNCCAHKERPQF